MAEPLQANTIESLLCRPGGLLGPSNRPIPPTGGGGAPLPLALVVPLPLSAVGGGILSEVELICRYSEGILKVPWLSIALDRREVRIQSGDICDSPKLLRITTPPRSGGLIAWVGLRTKSFGLGERSYESSRQNGNSGRG